MNNFRRVELKLLAEFGNLSFNNSITGRTSYGQFVVSFGRIYWLSLNI